MARKVKCQITKEWGTSDTFYKAPNGKYYKSKKLYEVRNIKSFLMTDLISLKGSSYILTGQEFF